LETRALRARESLPFTSGWFPRHYGAGGKEIVDGPAIFPTAWFSERQHAHDWFLREDRRNDTKRRRS
jgi:hypothetical protein